jgi:outer membrane protein assembly factor BamB
MGEKRTRREFLAVSSVVGTTVVAGCSGGGDSGSDSDDDEDTEAPEETMAPTATPEQNDETAEQTTEEPTEETTEEEEEEEEEKPSPDVSVDPWPLQRFDFSNTGFNSEGSGPEDRPSIQWEYDIDGAPVTTPVVSETSVYVGTSNDTLLALHPTENTVRWTKSLNGTPNTPAVGTNNLYVPNGDGLTAFDLVTGEQRWHYSGEGSGAAGPAMFANQLIYFASMTSNTTAEIYAVNTAGRQQWAQNNLDIGNAKGVPTGLALVDSTLFIATNAPGILKLNPADGGRMDTLNVGPTPGIAMNDSTIAFGGRSEAGVYNRNNDEVRGVLQDRISDVRAASPPLLTDEYAVFGTVTNVNASRRGVMGMETGTGNVRWDFGDSVEMRLPPTAAGRMLYAPATNTLHGGFTAGAGTWTVSFDRDITTPAIPSSGRLYMGLGGTIVVLSD